MENPIGYDCTEPGLYLYLPYLQDFLYLSSKPSWLWASCPIPLGRVDQLFVGPPIPLCQV
jgi:hypothetical protein